MSLYHAKLKITEKVTENSQRELIVNILINKKKKKTNFTGKLLPW